MEKNISSKPSDAEQYEGFPTRLVVLLIVIALGIVGMAIKVSSAF